MTNINLNSLRTGPDSHGRFGIHGGRFVAETLMPLILNVEKSYEEALKDQLFLDELDMYRKDYIGRPSFSLNLFTRFRHFSRFIPDLRALWLDN